MLTFSNIPGPLPHCLHQQRLDSGHSLTGCTCEHHPHHANSSSKQSASQPFLASSVFTHTSSLGRDASRNMADDSPPKKKSRFFSGGKSLINNIQTTFRTRTATAAEKGRGIEDTRFPTASAAVHKLNDTGNRPDEETRDDSPSDDDTEPQLSGPVPTATSALKNFSFTPNTTKRQGLGPEALKELTKKALQPTAAPPNQNTNSAVGTFGDNLVPRLMFSAHIPSTRRPPTPPAGLAAPGRQELEKRERLVHRTLPAQGPASNSSQDIIRPPGFPSLRSPDQLPNVPLSKDPSNQVGGTPHLDKPFYRHLHDAASRRRATSPQLFHPISNIPNAAISSLPLHATLTPSRRAHANAAILDKPHSTLPPTFWTSPERVQRAAAASRKRKRAGLVLPPPAYIYTRTNSPDFNIFPAILLYPELCFHLSSHLPLNSLVSLYAISRDFHTILDSRFTAVILSQSLAKAPESSRIFPFRCYAHLCRKDPASRIPHPDPEKARKGVARAVPSFRWLRMVLWREKVVHEIMAIMAEDGVPLPSRCSLALKRMWVRTSTKGRTVYKTP
jgi:hypothetical protein